ncbi:MAG TPA: hypothetical protein VL307_15345, partial [Chitinophagaceae bacterium]|nr:hypothetical protein [Chitinophagaceae bacterium]
ELIQSSGYPPAKRNLRPQLCIAPALAAENVAPFSAEKLQMPFLATFMLEELLLLRRHFALDEFKVAQLFRLRP